jgi:hypothetical protein
MSRTKITLAAAIKFVNQNGALLVFPHENRKEPKSLWYEFFPKTKMRWEWDDSGDSRVADLWHLRERLSTSRKVVYGKFFRGRATLLSFPLFTALLKLLNPDLPSVGGLSFQAREILDLLEEDSPVSTKQLKKLTDLQGRAAESTYQRALKELWDRHLIVAFGEVDEGAFPSIAVGATRVLFEDLWNDAEAMSLDEARSAFTDLLSDDSPFAKFYRTRLLKQILDSALVSPDV